MPEGYAVTRFAQLFAGRTDVAGVFDPDTNTTYTDKTLVNERLYRQHIEGRRSLGIFPLRDDNTVKWLCLDEDTNDADAVRVIRSVLVSYGLQPWIERSKGKGYHIWVFFSDYVPAAAVRRFAKRVLEEAGIHRPMEIFPKQDRVIAGGYGNFVNLPYDERFGDRRVMIEDDGTAIGLLDFLRRVEQRPFPDDIPEPKAPPERAPDAPVKAGSFRIGFGDRSEGYDGPPPTCVLHAMSSDAPEGTRNDTAARLIGYWYGFAGLDDDEAFDKLSEWNDQLNESLPERELRETFRKVSRRSYSWGCKRITELPQFKDGCSAPVCDLYRPGAFEEPDTLPIIQVTEPVIPRPYTEADIPVEDAPKWTDERDIADLMAVGWLRDYMWYCRAKTDAPRILHLAAGMAAVAACLGDRVEIPSYGIYPLRPSIYAMIVCPSGFFRKSTAKSYTQFMLDAVDPFLIVADNITPEAFSQKLDARRDRIMLFDEFGGMLHQWNTRPYLSDMKRMVTQLFDPTPVLKSKKGTSGDGEDEMIRGAAFTILGATTQDWLQDEMKITDLRSGFAARFLWVWADKKEPPVRRRTFDSAGETEHLVKHLRTLRNLPDNPPLQADFARVDNRFFDWVERFEAVYNKTGIDPDTAGVVARASAYVQKIACILSAAESVPVNGLLVVQPHHLEKAIIFVEWSIKRQEYMVAEMFAFTEFDKIRNRLMDKLKAAGGRLEYKTVFKIFGKKRREVQEYVETFVAAGDVVIVAASDSLGKPGPKPKFICFPHKVLPGDVPVM